MFQEGSEATCVITTSVYIAITVQGESHVVHRTEFAVTLPQEGVKLQDQCHTAPNDDEDEDIEGRRSPKRVIIYHTLATKLSDVGCQVWSASLLLTDWLIHTRRYGGKRDKLKTVLELGAGVGLPSLVAAACGADVLLTDCNRPALDLAKRSSEANAAWLMPRGGGTVKVLTPNVHTDMYRRTAKYCSSWT